MHLGRLSAILSAIGVAFMFHLFPANLKQIMGLLKQPLHKQRALFEALGISSNDYDPQGDGIIDAHCAISRESFDTEAVLAEPLDYLVDLTKERIAELSDGAFVTPDKLEKYYQNEAKRESQGSADTFAVIFTFGDGEREVYGLCINLMMGQGGNVILDFFGFFETVLDTNKARDRITEYVMV